MRVARMPGTAVVELLVNTELVPVFHIARVTYTFNVTYRWSLVPINSIFLKKKKNIKESTQLLQIASKPHSRAHLKPQLPNHLVLSVGKHPRYSRGSTVHS